MTGRQAACARVDLGRAKRELHCATQAVRARDRERGREQGRERETHGSGSWEKSKQAPQEAAFGFGTRFSHGKPLATKHLFSSYLINDSCLCSSSVRTSFPNSGLGCFFLFVLSRFQNDG